jgi:hypothetical protein
LILAFVVLSIWYCHIDSTNSKEKLKVVTYSQFDEFVKTTGYVTDAEKFWLIGNYQGWKCAVAGAAVTDLIDDYAQADI